MPFLLAWLQVAALAADTSVISTGDAVRLEEHLADGKFTVVEFGAAWCGSCRIAERTLARYADAHGDVAIRSVDLQADQPRKSMLLPVAKQYLRQVAALPWLIVYGPDGDEVYAGASVHDALRRLDGSR